MIVSKELHAPTRKAPLPYVTIIASTVALLLPLAAIGLMFWFTRSTPAENALSAEQMLRELQATEERRMTTYEWIEKPAKGKPGVVRVPVQRARELILKEASAPTKGTKP